MIPQDLIPSKDDCINRWKTNLKGHGGSCKCPLRTKARLRNDIFTCKDLELSEKSRLMDLLESKDSENWEVALHVIYEKIPDLFKSVIKTPVL